MNRKEWADAFLVRLEAPRSARNRKALVAWMHTEGYGGAYNPLNTSLKLPGSTTYNSHGVQNYASTADGITAAVRTLKEGRPEYGYNPIIQRLRSTREPEKTLKALIDSSWGTTDLVLEVLEDVERDFRTYAEKPASNPST